MKLPNWFAARRWIGVLLLLLLLSPAAFAQRQMEALGRGLVALRTGVNSVYLGWRLLGSDPEDTRFNVFRITGGVTNLIAANVTNSCNVMDNSAAQASAQAWFVQPVLNGVTQALSATFFMPAGAPIQQYLNLPLTPPPGGTTWDGVPFTYNANDASAGDVDGDREYELILKWDPTNSKDNSQSGFTGHTYLDCYKLDGTRLWRIDLGPNIRSGAHYTQFMVYDFDGDGKAELMCKTAPGSRDGAGSYVGGVTKWQNANGARPAFSDSADYRFNNPNNVTNGYVLAGPEFLTVFAGDTGGELATATYFPKRDPDNNNDNPTSSRLNTVWGDSYGNRLDRFLAGVAYLDGVRPSGVFCRGYYTRAYVAAWDWRTNRLQLRWTFASDPAYPNYRGQGAHSLAVGDADGDGRDEILYGAASINDDGSGHYSTGLGHGDAEHFSDMDPLRPGKEVWMVHESPSAYGPCGMDYRDAASGAAIFCVDGQAADIGRGVAYDIDPRYRGYEMWGSRGGLMSATGVQISSSRPGQMNFCAWWDADTLRETLDGTTVSKWNWTNSANNSILSPAGLTANNSTKSTPCLSADLFGDWREEIVWRTSDNLNLRIYSTTTPATNRLPTLMHDAQYRCAVAWQNTAYNQPPHPGFFLGDGMYPPPLPPISTAQLAWRGGNGGNDWSAPNNWVLNGVWTNDVPAAFSTGHSVLFDLRAANQTLINLTGLVSPGEITVHSPSNLTFTGTGSLGGSARLFKAGPGRLTLANTNSFTGGTFVSGGQLFVNGLLAASPVTLEARGEPWGRARLGGSGILGQGLTVQRDCGVIVGPGLAAPGTLTVSNALTQLGGVLNQFDLSPQPTNSGANDRIQVFGNVTLNGTNVLEINQTGGFLGGGVYPLITYTGTLTGGLTNLALSGDFIQPVVLTNPPGVIALVAAIPPAVPNPPSALVATALGAFQINVAWTDNSPDENAFVLERSLGAPSNFTAIALLAENTTSYPDVGLTANTTYFYRVRGTNLAGFSAYSNTNSATTTLTPPALTWKGDGVANLWDVATTANWLNGAATIAYADGAFVTFDQAGSNSPAISLATNVAPGSVTINASKNYTLNGPGRIGGGTALTKTGSGAFTLANTNAFTGGTRITNGTLIAGNIGANSAAFGFGAIQFHGGTLEFNGWTGNSGTEFGGHTNALHVPAGQSGTLRLPQRFQSPGLTGPLTGGGTLNLQVKYLRGDVLGNWSAFTGLVSVTRGNTGATVDDFRWGSAAGLPAGRLQLGTNVLMYSRAAAGSVIPIGEFSAAPGAVVTAGGCSGNCGAGTQNTVTWRIGGLPTAATNAALFSGTTSLIKEGNGSWTLTGDNSYSGTTVVNGGTLFLNGDQSAAAGAVSVNANGTLAGRGIIGGSTTILGTLAPGVSGIGTLTLVTNLTLGADSTTLLQVTKSPFTNDHVVVGGNLAFNGTLELVNTGVELFEAGDNFQLFSAATYSGQFSALELPVLEEGLAWKASKLNSDGQLWVVSTNPPVVTSVQTSGGQLQITGTGGTPQWDYYVLTATNLALPRAGWTRLATNQFNANGGFSFSWPLAPGTPRGFYCVEVP
jgi:rhamnogalacturonan endolyase